MPTGTASLGTASLALENVSHRYETLAALDDVSLSVQPGELVCLLGPSGCGKTTALRLAAGLETLQTGRIRLDGTTVADAHHAMPPEERSVGLVFQDYALFPHLRVLDNVMFGLRSLDRATRRTRALAALDRVGMASMAEVHPHQLSGGQQQRVAVARALAPHPRVMLLDEPFSGLDMSLRNQIRDETLHVLKETGVATLMVTHDPEEAMFMADRVALMRAGQVVQSGSPQVLYNHPANGFVAGFFGEVNQLRGEVRDGAVATPVGRLAAPMLDEGTVAEVLIRSEALRLHAPKGEAARPRGRVLATRLLGRSSLIHLTVPAAPEASSGASGGAGEGTALHLHARMPGYFLPGENTLVDIELNPAQAFVFPDAAEDMDGNARDGVAAGRAFCDSPRRQAPVFEVAGDPDGNV